MKHYMVLLPIRDQRLCISEVSKVVFVVFTQHCILSNVTHVRCVEGVLCIQLPLTPARREGYLSLSSWRFSGSPPVSLKRHAVCYLARLYKYNIIPCQRCQKK